MDKLLESNASPDDLRIESLAGHGQVHHRAKTYTDLAREVSEKSGTPFQVQVEWRADDEFVELSWRRWRNAHAQVEAITGPQQFVGRYRKLLTASSRYVKIIAPDEFL